DTRAGELELAIPKIRRGSYLPSFLEPRRRSEQALVSVIQQAYVCGVSTRKVDQLVESLGLRISRSEVSRVCAGLDEQVEAFRTRPLEGRYPYVWLDAKVEKVRDGGRVVRVERPLPKVAAMWERAEEDLLAFYAFPVDHGRKLRSTNPLERLNREIGRRTDVVGIFPDDASLIRLATSLVIEQNDEWLVGRRYLSLDSLAPLLEERREESADKEVLALTGA